MNAGAQGHLVHNLLLFGRLLRRIGIEATTDALMTVAEAGGRIGLARREDFQSAARAILVSRRQQIEPFDRAFELFWRATRGGGADVELGRLLRKVNDAPLRLELRLDERGDDARLDELEQPVVREQLTYSHRELLRHKDFAELTSGELREVKELIRELDWELPRRRTRRRVPHRRGDVPDLRRTLRRSLRHGGEPAALSWRRRRTRPRPLVALCDVSGSMEAYSRILLRFLFSLSHGLDRVETFLFGTRLTHVTRQLRGRDVDLALQRTAAAARDWSGGTRIGETVRAFNYRWGRRVLGRGAVVLVISDGWDCGDVELLEREMERLSLACHRLIWLNPLLGMPGYEPITRGLTAALPYVDEFLPVHNLASLEQLGERLSAIGRPKGKRRTHA